MTEEGKDLVVPGTQTPSDVIEFAQDAAKKLMDIVDQEGLAKVFRQGSKPHIFYEGWATVARFYNCTIQAEDAEPVGELDSKNQFPMFKAKANLLDIDGRVIGSATAYCGRDERNWKTRDNYALASMAQTRAGSKAARMVLSWVVVLAGYSATPAEEMDGIFSEEPNVTTQRVDEDAEVKTATASSPDDHIVLYATDSLKKYVEVWVKEHADGDRDSVKEWLVAAGKIGVNDAGIPTFNKVHKDMAERMKANPKGAATNYKSWLTATALGGEVVDA
jgi:hypothetical protein